MKQKQLSVNARQDNKLKSIIALRPWEPALVIVFLSLGLFLELADDVWRREGFSWDAPIMLAIHRYSTPLLDRVMWFITQTGSAVGVFLLVLLVAWLWQHRFQLEAGMFVISFVGGEIITALLKQFFARPRPDVFPPLASEHSYSFPSGHTIAAVSFYGLLAFFLWRQGRKELAFFSGLWVLAIAFSRVYLGVHYPSDVLGALAVGAIWFVIVTTGFDWLHRTRERNKPLNLNNAEKK